MDLIHQGSGSGSGNDEHGCVGKPEKEIYSSIYVLSTIYSVQSHHITS